MPISGKSGNVTAAGGDIVDVRSFTVSRSCDVKPYNSSDTSGQTKRIAGNKDWTAQISCYADGGSFDLGFDEGDSVSFVGLSTAGKQVAGTLVIETIEAEVDVEGGELVGIAITGGGDGALTPTG